MNIQSNTSRRTFLKHGSTFLAMPFLPSLLSAKDQSNLEKKSNKSTKRLLWMAMGHGHMEDHFYPKTHGKFDKIKIPAGLKPLQKNFQHMTMIANFSNMKNKQPHDGSEALLSCANVVGFPGKTRHNSISCDQVATKFLGQKTRYESMQFNCQNKDADNGHGGVAISYRADGSPLPGLKSPLEAYHKIFGGNISRDEQLQVLKDRRSILDLMSFESNGSKKLLNKEDREKLDEYTTSIRDIELALTREESWIDVPYPKSTVDKPKTNLTGEAEVKVMLKMIIAACQTDTSRVLTYRMPDAGLLRGMGISSSPHTLSHYGSNETLHKLNLQRTTKWMQIFSYFIDELRKAKDPLDPNGKSIHDNILVYCGGGLRTAHRTLNVPCLLTGGGFKGLKHGSHIKAPKENTALANLWLTMLQDAGAKLDSFADSTGTARAIFQGS